MRTRQPRVLYVMLGETDEWAHGRRYELYLDAAWRSDRFVRRLWELAQSLPAYRGKTALVLATDHGRGAAPADWTDHGEKVPAAESIWMAVMGPGTPALGVREGHRRPRSRSSRRPSRRSAGSGLSHRLAEGRSAASRRRALNVLSASGQQLGCRSRGFALRIALCHEPERFGPLSGAGELLQGLRPEQKARASLAAKRVPGRLAAKPLHLRPIAARGRHAGTHDERNALDRSRRAPRDDAVGNRAERFRGLVRPARGRRNAAARVKWYSTRNIRGSHRGFRRRHRARGPRRRGPGARRSRHAAAADPPARSGTASTRDRAGAADLRPLPSVRGCTRPPRRSPG